MNTAQPAWGYVLLREHAQGMMTGAGIVLAIVGIAVFLERRSQKRKIENGDPGIVGEMTALIDYLREHVPHSVDIHEVTLDGLSVGMHAHCLCGDVSEVLSMNSAKTSTTLEQWKREHIAEAWDSKVKSVHVEGTALDIRSAYPKLDTNSRYGRDDHGPCIGCGEDTTETWTDADGESWYRHGGCEGDGQ